MGLDQIFYKVKQKHNNKGINGMGFMDIVELQRKGEAEDILWLRKEYEISEMIRDMKKKHDLSDIVIIERNELKKIIEKYEDLIWEEEENKGYMIMVVRQLQLIDKLFDFEEYYLGYTECRIRRNKWN